MFIQVFDAFVCFHDCASVSLLGIRRLNNNFANSSDGRVDRACASGHVDSGLIQNRVKPMTVKLVSTPNHVFTLKFSDMYTDECNNVNCIMML